jgi:hypothetical protein
MHSYIDLYFTPDAESPVEISKRLRNVAGLPLIVGPHDLAFEWKDEEEFQSTLSKIHQALKGTGVLYRVETVAEESSFVEPVVWPALPSVDRIHPAF